MIRIIRVIRISRKNIAVESKSRGGHFGYPSTIGCGGCEKNSLKIVGESLGGLEINA